MTACVDRVVPRDPPVGQIYPLAVTASLLPPVLLCSGEELTL
jgi:hypothetical protein